MISLNFTAGMTEVDVSVSTENDTLFEGRENFTGSLRNPSPRLQLGMPNETIVFIEDNGELKNKD